MRRSTILIGLAAALTAVFVFSMPAAGQETNSSIVFFVA